MAQMICLKSELFDSFRVLENKPFDIIGYETPKFENNNKKSNIISKLLSFIQRILFFYVQMTFLRPGYKIVKCRHKKSGQVFLIASCHLVINIEGNPNRII